MLGCGLRSVKSYGNDRAALMLPDRTKIAMDGPLTARLCFPGLEPGIALCALAAGWCWSQK